MGYSLLFNRISFYEWRSLDTIDLSDIQWDIANFTGHRTYSNGIWLAIYLGYGLLVHAISFHDWIALDTKDLVDIQMNIVNFHGTLHPLTWDMVCCSIGYRWMTGHRLAQRISLIFNGTSYLFVWDIV